MNLILTKGEKNCVIASAYQRIFVVDSRSAKPVAFTQKNLKIWSPVFQRDANTFIFAPSTSSIAAYDIRSEKYQILFANDAKYGYARPLQLEGYLGHSIIFQNDKVYTVAHSK